MTRTLLVLTAVAGVIGLGGLLFNLSTQMQLGLLAAGAALASTPAVFGMVLDERTEFADALVIPTATGRALFGDVVDSSVARNLGSPTRPLYFVFQITTTVTSAGAATLQIELVSDAQAAIAVDGTATIHYSSAAIPKATLVAGYVAAVVPLPGEPPTYERYLGVITNPGTAALTAGNANAFLTSDPKQWKAYDNGI